MAYAAEWDLDDNVLDREEVEAVVAHVAALAHVAAEVTCGRQGLYCTFRFPVAAAADVVAALDPAGELLGDDWYRDLDPPSADDPEEGYTVRIELLGPVDGGLVDDDVTSWEIASADDRADDEPEADAPGLAEPADDPEEEGGGDDDEPDAAVCLARLRAESLDNREAWPIAFAIAAAIVDRLGGDLRDEIDDELFELQRQVPRVIVNGVESAPVRIPEDSAGEDELLN